MERKMLEQRIANDMVNFKLGTLGTDIFIGQLPEDVTTGVFLVPASSPPPQQIIDTEEHVIDFWCRSDHTDTAYNKLQAIYNTYNRRANYPLGDWYIYFSGALGTIMDMDRDREGGKLFKLSVSFLCRNITNVS